jgi:hypothetical protein
LNSDIEDIKPIDKNASEALQSFRNSVLVLAQCPPDKRPSDNLQDAAQFDALVGKYAGLLPVLELPSNAQFCETALLGALALQAGRTKVAIQILDEVNFGTSNVTALVYVMRGFLVFVSIMVVLSMLFFLILAGLADLHAADSSFVSPMEVFTSGAAKVFIGTVFGCLGAAVSLLQQLPDFEVLKGKSRTFLMALGGTQPVIGGIFGFVIGALISAKIINISIGGSSDLSAWLFVVLGFLAGFNERFTRGLLRVAESHFGSTTGPTLPSPMR